jgi:hypothetical protein
MPGRSWRPEGQRIACMMPPREEKGAFLALAMASDCSSVYVAGTPFFSRPKRFFPKEPLHFPSLTAFGEEDIYPPPPHDVSRRKGPGQIRPSLTRVLVSLLLLIASPCGSCMDAGGEEILWKGAYIVADACDPAVYESGRGSFPLLLTLR